MKNSMSMESDYSVSWNSITCPHIGQCLANVGKSHFPPSSHDKVSSTLLQQCELDWSAFRIAVRSEIYDFLVFRLLLLLLPWSFAYIIFHFMVTLPQISSCFICHYRRCQNCILIQKCTNPIANLHTIDSKGCLMSSLWTVNHIKCRLIMILFFEIYNISLRC